MSGAIAVTPLKKDTLYKILIKDKETNKFTLKKHSINTVPKKRFLIINYSDNLNKAFCSIYLANQNQSIRLQK